MRKIAIIGGSGVYDLNGSNFQKIKVNTPYGDVSCLHGAVGDTEVTFITRHGEGHSVPPHMINYRANICALKQLGVTEILATAAVGSLNPNMQAGQFVVCDQVLDFTKSRINTFFDGIHYPVGHADFTHPYCPTVREILMQCLDELGVKYHKTGTMVVTEGPRFESGAEIKMFRQLGGDVVGMTSMPECILAREAEMHYSCVAMVTNMAAGISTTQLSHREVLDVMSANGAMMGRLIGKFIKLNCHAEKKCNCENTMQEFGGFIVKK